MLLVDEHSPALVVHEGLYDDQLPLEDEQPVLDEDALPLDDLLPLVVGEGVRAEPVLLPSEDVVLQERDPVLAFRDGFFHDQVGLLHDDVLLSPSSVRCAAGPHLVAHYAAVPLHGGIQQHGDLFSSDDDLGAPIRL